MSTLGARLRAARAAKGMNQDEFAALAGVSRRAQVNYESDERTPEIGYLLALGAVGVDLLYVITGLPVAATQRLAAVRESANILTKMGLPSAQSAALMEALFDQLVKPQQQGLIGLTLRERALLDNYRHASSEAQRALEQTSAALAQPVAIPVTPKRKVKTQGA